ncbi:hypothetical protein L345_08537, partial [Ophiophagus hannah]
MNSAGYLLGPRRIEQLLKEMPSARGREEPPGECKMAFGDAMDKIFSVKHGLAGKRDINLEENVKADTSTRLLSYNNIMRTIIEFLAYLHLKEPDTNFDVLIIEKAQLLSLNAASQFGIRPKSERKRVWSDRSEFLVEDFLRTGCLTLYNAAYIERTCGYARI